MTVFSPGQIVGGRYRIVRYLNRGGMGEVYEAEHPLLPDHVALKTLLPAIASDQVMVARFKREIQLARKIAHPNVCKVFDLEWHREESAAQGAVFFLTMEFLPGETLSERIDREGRLSPAAALPLLEKMAEALEAAHQAGVIHRDFKPSNVMLVPSGRGVRVVVTDFGLAGAIPTESQPTATSSGLLAGTLDYMAPELLAGAPATVRSDVYALGMVTYKIVTGELPLSGDSPLAAALLRARKPAPSPRTLTPDLDPKWERAILRAIDRDPGRRFSGAGEFPRALRGQQVSATISIPPLTRRNLFAAGGVAAALATGWAGWLGWSKLRNQPGPEAARLYQQGVDDIQAGAYFAATKALDQAVRLAPSFSPARARLAESWLELDLPETALFDFAPIRRRDNSWLPKLDRLRIEAIDLTITHELAAALAKYQQMRKLAGPDAADLDIDLGRAYEKAGQTDQAIEAYRRAAEGPSHSAAAWLRLGVLYSRQSQAKESQAAFAEADRGYRQSSNMEGITELTLQRGIAANRASRYADAEELLRRAMDYARGAGNLQQEIGARLILANVYYRAGDTDQAKTLAADALAAAQANQMESLSIRGFINLGGAQVGAGDYPGAEARFQEALSLAQRTGSSRLAAQSRLNLASLYDRMHRFEDQIREATAALSYYQPHRWVQETFQALLLIGRGEEDRGNYAAALDSFQRLLDSASKVPDRATIAQAQEGLGDVLSGAENYPAALEHYRGFLAACDDPETAGYAARDCGFALSRLGRYDEALTEFASAEASAPPNSRLRPSIARSRAEVALSRNQFKEVLDESAATLAHASNLNPVVAADLKRIAGLALLRSTGRKAGLQKCEEAYAEAQNLGDPGEVFDAAMALLEARLATGDAAGARQIFHGLEPDLAAHPESQWRAFALLARTDRQYADRAQEAIGQLETLWGREAFQQYLKRPDVHELSRPFLQTSSANR